MGEHEPQIGASDEWYTPPFIFDALKLRFDLDPCSPGPRHWVPANHFWTKDDDALAPDKHWWGRIFMNPPFGGRLGHLPWLQRFYANRNGIAIVRAYTSAGWFHDYIPLADAVLFPKGKTKFIRPDGSVGGSPGTGVVLIAFGDDCVKALRNSGLGWCP
jgi:hypothetical protein